MRGLFWGAALPIAILAGAFMHPIVLAGTLAYPIQIARIALQSGATKRQSWIYALFITLAKFAEADGVMKQALERLRGRTATLIEYKDAETAAQPLRPTAVADARGKRKRRKSHKRS
jgi:hypothetical protein